MIKGLVRVFLVAGSVLLLWVILGWLIGPAIISDAYRGESLSVFNDALTGQSVFPLEHYLAYWASLRVRVLVWLLVGTAIAVSLLLLKAVAGERLARLATRLGGRDPFTIPWRWLFGYAISIGAVAGLLEFGGLRFHSLYSGRPPWPSSPFAIWLTPVATISALCIVVAIASPLLVRWPWLRSTRVVVTTLAFISILAVVRVTVPAVHPVAAGILAGGVALRLGWLGAARGPATHRLTRRLTPLLAGLVALLAIGQHATVVVRERLAFSRVAAADSSAPNVLILLLDTVRARNLSVYGYERATSPGLERIAERGVVFERAATTSSWSLPSHASLFTGRYHPELTGQLTAVLDESYPTLAEILTARGYRTGAFFANQLFGNRYFGLDRGFVHHETKPLSIPLMVQDSWILRTANIFAARYLGVIAFQVRETGTEVNRRVLRWLDKDPDRPFFVFANYFDAHDPYMPPAPFDTLYWPVTPRGWFSDRELRYPEEKLREIIAAYDGAITYVDHEVDRLLQELEDRGLTRNTILIVLSDHGEGLGAHGLMGHGLDLYMESIRVPFLVSFPGRVAEGRRVAPPVSLRSVPATVLDLLGVRRGEVAGRSLADYLTPGQLPDTGVGAVYSQLSPQTAQPERQPDWMPTRYGELKSLLWEDYHYILRGDGKEELFDLGRDPFERIDLADSASAAEPLRQARMLMDSVARASAEKTFVSRSGMTR